LNLATDPTLLSAFLLIVVVLLMWDGEQHRGNEMNWSKCTVEGPCSAMQVELHEVLKTGESDTLFDPVCPHCGGDLRLAVSPSILAG
jgi:hypothetical protein